MAAQNHKLYHIGINKVPRATMALWDSPKRHILGLGCGLPIDTTSENIHALVQAAKE